MRPSLRDPGYAPQSVPGQLAGNPHWWRRGDSTFRSFRCGLDYAFIRCARKSEADAERVIRMLEPSES
jgi:hypothetical protein